MIRLVVTILMLFASAIDLSLTYYYIQIYLNWQPKKPLKLIERNVLLLFLWETLGLEKGMLVGSAIILFMIYYISMYALWWVVLILAFFLFYAIRNHNKNIKLLNKLMHKYPSGHLPKEVFGKVEGGN